MAAPTWATTDYAVKSLQLDTHNPRLPEDIPRSPREIIQHLFDHDKALDLATSIATRGFFSNEPLLAIEDAGRTIVVEGNRRLAALKALLDPRLVEGANRKALEKLAAKLGSSGQISTVPVTMAPNRRATDPQIAGRHVGTPVLAWEAENRARFILAKLEEGYNDAALEDQLGFSASDVQKARQTKAIADMARSLDLNGDLKAKLDNPRAQVFSTIGRVFDSTVGRKYLGVEPDQQSGIRGTTTTDHFVPAFKKLVVDVIEGRASSRKLNTNENIASYFDEAGVKPAKSKGKFAPDDIVSGKKPGPATAKAAGISPAKHTKKETTRVVPRNFQVYFGTRRLKAIRDELAAMDRETFPNAGAVLLRVFLELSIEHYLDKTGDLKRLKADLAAKGKLRYDRVELQHMIGRVVSIAKAKLDPRDATSVEKALRYDAAAPFSIRELHDFVHAQDQPNPRDIKTFWQRTEPLFRLMLEKE